MDKRNHDDGIMILENELEYQAFYVHQRSI